MNPGLLDILIEKIDFLSQSSLSTCIIENNIYSLFELIYSESISFS